MADENESGVKKFTFTERNLPEKVFTHDLPFHKGKIQQLLDQGTTIYYVIENEDLEQVLEDMEFSETDREHITTPTSLAKIPVTITNNSIIITDGLSITESDIIYFADHIVLIQKSNEPQKVHVLAHKPNDAEMWMIN